jgi:2-isopropylmalate synthase
VEHEGDPPSRDSTHCHNDRAWQRQIRYPVLSAGASVEVTISSIGERAGNTSLEEVVMIMKSRKHLGIETGIVTENIIPAAWSQV